MSTLVIVEVVVIFIALICSIGSLALSLIDVYKMSKKSRSSKHPNPSDISNTIVKDGLEQMYISEYVKIPSIDDSLIGDYINWSKIEFINKVAEHLAKDVNCEIVDSPDNRCVKFSLELYKKNK